MQYLTSVTSLASALQPSVQKIGLLLMSVAATAGLFELPDHPSNRGLVPAQAVFAPAGQTLSETTNPLRREKEESAPHYISYSAVQRTPGRTGRY